MVNISKSIYKEPSFQVIYEEEISEEQKQETGIRQGCPLSPYLFILVMTVMFEDIHRKLGTSLDCSNLGLTRRGKVEGLNFSESLYADDTLLALRDSVSMNKLVAEIEVESDYYNLKLNK